MPKRSRLVPVNKHIRIPVSDDEHDRLKKRAGGDGLAAFFRKLAGLPPRKPGRPPKSK
jgi:hypothetical protein